mgnify:CR=1 FL=1
MFEGDHEYEWKLTAISADYQKIENSSLTSFIMRLNSLQTGVEKTRAI